MKGISMAKKSRGQKRQAKIRTRQQRRSRSSSPPSIPLPFLGGRPFGDEPDAPQGFRPVSITQAMMEYAAPIMAYVADGTVADPNDALQVGVLLWNSTLPAVPVPMRPSRGEMGVSTPPGCTELHRILSWTCSSAVALVKRRTAPLVAMYAASPGLPRNPAVDEIFTMEPSPARRIAGMACLVPRNTPFALTAMRCSHSASLVSSRRFQSTIPALFTRISSLP